MRNYRKRYLLRRSLVPSGLRRSCAVRVSTRHHLAQFPRNVRPDEALGSADLNIMR